MTRVASAPLHLRQRLVVPASLVFPWSLLVPRCRLERSTGGPFLHDTSNKSQTTVPVHLPGGVLWQAGGRTCCCRARKCAWPFTYEVSGPGAAPLGSITVAAGQHDQSRRPATPVNAASGAQPACGDRACVDVCLRVKDCEETTDATVALTAQTGEQCPFHPEEVVDSWRLYA